MQATCARCGQTTITPGGPCPLCTDRDRDQGDQLGLIHIPPTQPARSYQPPAQPQPEGLF